MNKKKITMLILAMFVLTSMLGACKPSAVINPKLEIGGNSELAGTMGTLVKPNADGKYGGYLGYGYNVVTGDYFNSGDVGTGAMILDMDTMMKDGFVYEIDKSDTSTSLYMGETIKKYQDNVASTLGLSTSYGLFFSSVSADFSLSTSSSTAVSSNSVFIKNQIKIQKKRQLINTADLTYEDIIKYSKKTLVDALNVDTTGYTAGARQKYYETIFSKYGTHILADIVLGGRMDLNYTYSNKSKKTENDLRMEVNYAYSNVRFSGSGSVSTETKKRAEEFVSNTTFSGRRLGGSTAGDISNYIEAKNSYASWSESIENNTSLELIDVGANCADSLIEIWKLAKDDKQAAIMSAYQTYLDAAGKKFADIDNRPRDLYIKNIYVGMSKASEALAKSDVDAIISREDAYAPKVTVNCDMNRGVHGQFIYIAYTLTANPDEAITDVKLEWWNKESNAGNTYAYNGITYNCIKKDFNADAGGKYIYIYSTKDRRAGAPLTELGYEADGSYSFGSSSTGWLVITGLTSNDRVDCNMKSGGPYIYLWEKR